MDIIGTAPTSEMGAHFRANIAGWVPLAQFLTTTFPEETSGCTYWYSNDADGLDAPGAAALAVALQVALDDGVVDEYIDRLAAEAATVPRRPCMWCEGIGLRRDELGIEHGAHRRDPYTGRGGCNACQGLGTLLPPWGEVRFARGHAEEFLAFLRDCGGFRIH